MKFDEVSGKSVHVYLWKLTRSPWSFSRACLILYHILMCFTVHFAFSIAAQTKTIDFEALIINPTLRTLKIIAQLNKHTENYCDAIKMKCELNEAMNQK